MMHFEGAFKLTHECYNRFSKTHLNAVISHWCNWSRDAREIAHKDMAQEGMQKILHELTRALGTRTKSYKP